MEEYKDCRKPVLPTDLHIPDPEAHIMPDGRIYVYGSWDQEEKIYCSKEYRVYSSENMVDWLDHGISFDSSKVPWVFDLHAPKYPGSIDWSKPTPFLKKMIERDTKDGKLEISKFPDDMLFAPDAIHRDGKYYLYFCMADSSEGVAIADKPEGPFYNPVQLPCGASGSIVIENGQVIASFFEGFPGKHEIKLRFSKVNELEIHSLSFR